jgi:hypothetical protein
MGGWLAGLVEGLVRGLVALVGYFQARRDLETTVSQRDALAQRDRDLAAERYKAEHPVDAQLDPADVFRVRDGGGPVRVPGDAAPASDPRQPGDGEPL